MDRLQSALSERYTIQRELGSGGMATVYLAEDLKHERQVAIKVLRPELAAALGPERFLREIKTTAQLNHPHILALHDSGEAEGFLYYVMPYVEGESLRDRLNREKQLGVEDALKITGEVADALDFAHTHDVIHRDIKPENILLSGGHAVVADFGIAKAVTAAGGTKLTDTGLAVGTPAYMSPEQASAESELDGRSDVYSLGCVLYEMLSGEPPYTGSTAQAIMAKRMATPVPSVRTVRDTVPVAVDEALTKALAKVPADRYSSARQLAVELSRPVNPAPHHTARRWAAAAAIGFVALGSAVGLFRGTRGADGPNGGEPPWIVVRPFALLGAPDDAFVASGLTNEVRNLLTSIELLNVFGPSTGLRAMELTEVEVGEELGADFVLDGTVQVQRVSGDAAVIHTTATLTQTADGALIWSYDDTQPLEDFLAVQRDIATRTVEGVGIELGEPLRLSQPPVGRAAQEAYLKGIHHNSRGTGPGVLQAIEYHNEAIAIDSTYALAYAGLARACNLLNYVTPTPAADAVGVAKEAAIKALTLDETLAEAHSQLAWALAVYDWDWEGAERAFRRANELNPGLAGSHHQYAFFLAWQGRHAEALGEAERALELDPVNLPAMQNLAMVHYLARRHDDAIEQAQRTIDMGANGMWGYLRLGHAYEAKEMYEEAVTAYERAEAINPDPRRKGLLGGAYASAGRIDEARAILSELLEMDRRGYIPPTAVALVYTGLGLVDEALAWLARGADERDGDMILLKAWPVWDSLRSEPRFEELLARVGFPD